MAIEMGSRPEDGGDLREIGGEYAGAGPVIHYAADGRPRLREIELASAHPEHIAAALEQIRRLNAVARQ